MFMKQLTIISFILIFSISSRAQVPTRDIKELSFMSGKWSTHGAWGDMEESWSDPLGNCMVCAYRCVKEGKVIFYEFIVIEQQGQDIIMKLRHFSPGNIGWEEKDKPYEYPLMFLEKDRARFERPDKKTALTFERVTPEKLKVILERQDKNGKWVTDEFDYGITK
jgi:hypothetical protein